MFTLGGGGKSDHPEKSTKCLQCSKHYVWGNSKNKRTHPKLGLVARNRPRIRNVSELCQLIPNSQPKGTVSWKKVEKLLLNTSSNRLAEQTFQPKKYLPYRVKLLESGYISWKHSAFLQAQWYISNFYIK